jgi:carboxylesterase
MDNLIALNTAAQPCATYDEALARLAILEGRDGPEVNPVCRSYALTHGKKTARVLVYFHGYTNCPEQFRQLGAEFHRRGYSVLVPRQPHQGLQDRLTADQAQIRAAELVQSANEAVDIACGLGDEVIVSGLSGGGVMAAWAAQVRSDVDVALVAAPALGLPFVSPTISDVVKVAMQTLPNFFVWWDPRLKENLPDCPHAYPRWATRALGEFMRMGTVIRTQARLEAPAAQRVVMMTNANDLGINNKIAYQLTAAWQRHAPDRVEIHEFAKEHDVFHDMIDPGQSRQKVAIVYPAWLRLIDGDGAYAAPTGPTTPAPPA